MRSTRPTSSRSTTRAAASTWTSLVHLTNPDYAFRGLSFAPDRTGGGS